MVVTTPAMFRVAGAGALTCLQGLLTNDLVQPGDGSLVYGALLTPKGAIVVDAWVLRQGDALTLIVPRDGREAALEIFRRSLPPRLARLSDLTDESRVAWLVGEHAFRMLVNRGSRSRNRRAGWRPRGRTPPARSRPSRPRPPRLSGSWPVPPRRWSGSPASWCSRGRAREKNAICRPSDPRGLAGARPRDRGANPAAGSPVRRDRRGVVHQGLLYRAGDGRPAPFPRAYQPRAARHRLG